MSRNRPENAEEAMEAMAALVRQLHAFQGARGGGDGAEILAQLGGGGGGGTSLALLNRMKNDADENEQLSALNDFCMDLSMGRGDAFRPQDFVPVLMACLKKSHNPNIPLLAARGLTYFVDNTPRAVEVILRMEFLGPILDTLRDIADMELAEQTVTCISNICKVAPQAVLQADGLSAVLGFIDFFSIVTQRTILGIVADVTRKFKKEHLPLVQPVLPQIRNYIAAEDNKMAEAALTAMIRMVQNTTSDPDVVFKIFDGSAAALVDVLCKRPTEAIFSAALQLLSAAASKSAKVAEELIKLNAVGTLVSIVEPQKQALGREGSQSPGPVSPSLGPQASPTGKTATNRGLAVDRVKDITKCLAGLAPAVEGRDSLLSHIDKVATLRPLSSARRQHRSEGADEQPRGATHHALARLMQMRGENNDEDDEGGFDMLDEANSDEEYEDIDDDEDTLDDEEIQALAAELVSEGRIKVVNIPPKHAHCNAGRHLCDKCERTIHDSNMWYRCNARPDFDVCARCLVKEEFLESADNTVFTHMASVFPPAPSRPTPTTTTTASGSPTTATTDAAGEDQNGLLVRLIGESPNMLQLLSAALPCLSRLAIEVDDIGTRNLALEFICRVLHYSSAETLVATLHDTPLCETVTSLIATPSLAVQTRCLFIVQVLIEKLPNIYSNLFIREGVTNGLAVLKSNVSVDARTEASTATWAERLKHEGTWKAFLASEAADLLVTFASADDCGRLSHLEALRTKLDDKSDGASPFEALLPELIASLGDVSTFELMHSGVIGSILEALGRNAAPPLALLEFVTRLAAAPASEMESGGSLLAKLVHMLQSIVAQAEQFKKPEFEKDDRDIILTISPHDPKELEEQLATKIARLQAAAKKSDAEAAKRKDSKKKGGPPPAQKDSSLEDTIALLKDLAASPVPKTSGEAKKGVRIDSQAAIEGVANFAQSTLLPNPSGGGEDPSSRSSRTSAAPSPTNREADDVMTVDPFDGEASPPGTPLTANPPSTPPKPTVYIRYKRTALPLNMTMATVMKTFIKTDPDRAADSRALSDEMGLGFSALMGAGLMRSRELVHLHYSTTPFTFPTVTNPEIYTKSTSPMPGDGGSTGGGDVVQYSPESLPTAASIALRNALSPTGFERTRSLNITDALFDTLRLLQVLFDACTQWNSLVRWVVIHKADPDAWDRYPPVAPSVSLDEFTSQKLSNKALQHGAVKEGVGQQWGAWYIKLALDFPFLFTLSVRKFLMEATFMGTARSMVRIQEYLKENGARVDNSLNNNDSSVHRVHRQKVRVKREYPLESAMQVFDKSKASNACVFEFQYEGEVGTGLGPTMEFYSLVGEALQKKKLGLWRDGDEDAEADTYLTVEGLYPRPMVPTTTAPDKVDDAKRFVRHFQFIGRYLARVLLDRRIPNMRFSAPFIKMLRGDELAFDDLALVSPKMYGILEAMAIALNAKQGSAAESEGPLMLSSLSKPASIEDLSLTFVLPGAEDVPLCEGGEDRDVTSANASEYLAKVSTALLKDTMQVAAKAVREGFGSVFSLTSLKMLTVPELLGLFMGSRDPVTVAELDTFVVCDHGYISTSKPVRMFFELLSEMTFEKQCQFFQFLTGSPSLPVGGLSSLKPPMTIVRKTSGDPKVPEDSQLPSAMTCQNYLKLPAYETKEQMAAKLSQALENGGSAFHFS